MADGAFCDYQQQMDSMLPHLSFHGGRSAHENIDGDSHSKAGSAAANFYMEQFPPGMPTTMMESLGLTTSTANLSGHTGITEAMAASMMSQAAMFESAMNYALKPEKGLPPTPPGSPDEPKDARTQQSSSNTQPNYHSSMHPASMVALQSSINPNILAKPVPMRRMSDKTETNPRSNITHQSSASSSSSASQQDLPLGPPPDSGGGASPALARALAAVQQTQKRPRSEKKPIPDEQKDGKYFERRKRNNNAAKKSRDARKAREDEIAIRASFLEKENAILRAQVTTLREEANSLRQLLLQKRSRH